MRPTSLAPLCWALLVAAAPQAAPAPSQGRDVIVIAPSGGPDDKDERGLWMQADEAERRLKASNFVIRDAALNEYIRSVLCRTVGDKECGATRVYVTRTPYFNASMMPNGVMQVWSGLFLRVRDEAQLAAVLAHEYAHYKERHSLRLFRNIKSKTNAVAFLSILPVGGLAAGAIGAAQLGMIGSVFGFSREMERDADAASVTAMTAAGYDPNAAPGIWRQINAEAEATAAARKRRKRSEGGMFASHPPSAERIAALDAQAAGRAGELGADRYRAALAPFWADFIDDQVKINDFGGTELLLAQLAGGRWTPDLLYARAELYRARGAAGDYERAVGFYESALAAGTAPAEAHRGLGLCYLRVGQAVRGKASIGRYLEIKPGASDRAMMTMLTGV
ncbi:M48 family metalloprotease [uncultured Sphingomonas sp.]|uniref:M48 family metallopeptidase n=1 Tax=uncultured Sphingomonas sp. TaxID=158754 RepID=UPI0035CA50F4